MDDEREHRWMLRQYSKEILKSGGSDYEVIEFDNGRSLLEYCQNVDSGRIDLLILDIEMPRMDGIEIKEKLLYNDKVFRMLFVTSHEEYMGEAFGIKVINFLTKPVQKERLMRNIKTVQKELLENVQLPLEGLEAPVYLEQVEYIQSENNYTFVWLHRQKKRLLSTMKLKEVEKRLENLPIIRVHKSYMVNLMHVSAVGKYITFKDSTTHIPVGRTYVEQVKEAYKALRSEQIRGRMA